MSWTQPHTVPGWTWARPCVPGNTYGLAVSRVHASGTTYLAIDGEVVASGALGGTIGRNIWGNDNITGAVQAFKAIIHDKASPDEALKLVGA